MTTIVYPNFVTTTVTLHYIQVTTAELLRQYLCQHPVGTLIETSIRALAAKIGRAQGSISDTLDQLEIDGYISTIRHTRGTLVEVLTSDQESDRLSPSIHPLRPEDLRISSDQESDRLPGKNTSDQTPDRSDVYGTHDSESCSSSSMRESTAEQISQPPRQPEQIDNPIITACWPAMLRGTRGYTVAVFEVDFATMLARGYDEESAARIIATARSNGEPIYTNQELQTRARTYRVAHHIAPEEPHASATTNQTRSGAAHPADGTGRPSDQRHPAAAYRQSGGGAAARSAPAPSSQPPALAPGSLANLPKVQLSDRVRALLGSRRPYDHGAESHGHAPDHD